ncbi:MAG: hypothetical protein R3224_07005 [Balneolaceae bacterium]|nr:hypothetical protein [Balneolaceae bacterium]
MKLVAQIEDPDLPIELKRAGKRLSSGIMSEAISGDFISAAKKLCMELRNIFEIDHVSFWTISNGEPSLISTAGMQLPSNYGADRFKQEPSYQKLLNEKESYLHNHVFQEEEGIAAEFSRENDLPAEIGVPMYTLNELNLLKNNMEIPDNVSPFACLILKRNKLFSSKEFKVISRFLTRTGSIFWRLYNAI